MKIQKLRNAAEGRTCVRCGAPDAVLAHYSGPRQHAYGKGRGIKGHDAVAAMLCSVCHSWFDEYKDGNTVERSEEFLHYVALTIIRLFNSGVIK
jgi:hypothetical protein